ncbi:MAG: hypothetical protein IPO26_13965 [Saprospiraceae bacterium]|nr:hypothetical protein [Saprospiraceae bacterium]
MQKLERLRILWATTDMMMLTVTPNSNSPYENDVEPDDAWDNVVNGKVLTLIKMKMITIQKK